MSVTVTPYDSIPFPEDLASLAERSRAADGEPPFSDQTLVDLRSGRAGVTCVVATDGDDLVGAAVVVGERVVDTTVDEQALLDDDPAEDRLVEQVGLGEQEGVVAEHVSDGAVRVRGGRGSVGAHAMPFRSSWRSGRTPVRCPAATRCSGSGPVGCARRGRPGRSDGGDATK